MCKKTKVIGLAIATILTAYIAALTLSSQAFAQPTNGALYRVGLNVLSSGLSGDEQAGAKLGSSHVSNNLITEQYAPQEPCDKNICTLLDKSLGPNLLAGHEVQAGKVLADEEAQLGKILAGHEAQLGKILAGEVDCTPGSVYYPPCRSVVP